MANYTLLRRGDHLPAVGVLQKLLNRGGARLVADGAFGPATQTAVNVGPSKRNVLVPPPSWSRTPALTGTPRPLAIAVRTARPLCPRPVEQCMNCTHPYGPKILRSLERMGSMMFRFCGSMSER